jgi:tripartite-type tricarboxylate transporter receptor subunit TctC
MMENRTATARRGVTRRTTIAAAMGAIALVLPAAAFAQQWRPTRPIEFIVPFAPGGGTDLLARALAEGLAADFKVPVQVINRAGGSGIVGFEEIAAAKPDGSKIGLLTAQLITANLRGVMKISHNDFAPVGMVSIDYAGVAVPTASEAKTLAAFLDQARARPGALTVGNGGEGGTFHMLARNLEDKAGVKFKHVAFEGGPAAILQLLGGHIDSTINGLTEVLPYVKSGQLRMLAVAGPERFSGLPDVPTSSELGYPLDIATWRAVGVPKDTPAEIVASLEAAVERAMKTDKSVATMQKIGANPSYLNGKGLKDYLVTQETVYRKIYQ